MIMIPIKSFSTVVLKTSSKYTPKGIPARPETIKGSIFLKRTCFQVLKTTKTFVMRLYRTIIGVTFFIGVIKIESRGTAKSANPKPDTPWTKLARKMTMEQKRTKSIGNIK